jgi:hypothetical protein
MVCDGKHAASPLLAGLPLRGIYDNIKPSATTRSAGAFTGNFFKGGLQRDRIRRGFQRAINITGGEDVGTNSVISVSWTATIPLPLRKPSSTMIKARW